MTAPLPTRISIQVKPSASSSGSDVEVSNPNASHSQWAAATGFS
jgi:hypothetical protein